MSANGAAVLCRAPAPAHVARSPCSGLATHEAQWAGMAVQQAAVPGCELAVRSRCILGCRARQGRPEA